MAPSEIVPSLSVVPIMGCNPDGSCGPFLGTAAFVGENSMLITCEHVLAQWNGRYAFSAHEDKPRLYEAEPIARNAACDLACMRAKNYQPPFGFPLAEDDDVMLNQLVCAFEYGTTLTAGKHILLFA